jgi:hypothetical protein
MTLQWETFFPIKVPIISLHTTFTFRIALRTDANTRGSCHAATAATNERTDLGGAEAVGRSSSLYINILYGLVAPLQYSEQTSTPLKFGPYVLL